MSFLFCFISPLPYFIIQDSFMSLSFIYVSSQKQTDGFTYQSSYVFDICVLGVSNMEAVWRFSFKCDFERISFSTPLKLKPHLFFICTKLNGVRRSITEQRLTEEDTKEGKKGRSGRTYIWVKKNHCGVENLLGDESMWTNCIKRARNRRWYLPVRQFLL